VCVEPGEKGTGIGPAWGLVLVWHTWFPSYLSLEGTRSYPELLGRNRWPTIPGVQDPDKSHRNCGTLPFSVARGTVATDFLPLLAHADRIFLVAEIQVPDDGHQVGSGGK
jgi:hypothetical protein